ncbi:MAG: hypothetical protein AABY15_01770 [Nanoarchaeota archaeon]
MKKISFDFDGCLNDHFDGENNPNKEGIRTLLKELYESEDFEVYIITRRFGPERPTEGKGNEFVEVIELLKNLNIVLPQEKIIFTNREYKYSTVHKLGIDIHIDDEERERDLINKFTKGSAVDATNQNWRKKFDELL